MFIKVRNGHEHNLKHINIDIPRNKLVVFTGLSGAGKSSLVFDIIYAESQRQYLESLSTYSRRLMPKFSRPKADEISGISPAIIIDQKRLGTNPRSTVGTVTEIYTYLRLLFSRYGKPTIGDSNLFSFNNPEGACENCKGLGEELKIDKELIFDWDRSIQEGGIRYSEYRPGSRRNNILVACGLFDINKPLKVFSQEDIDKLLYSGRLIFQNSNQGFIQNFSFEGIVTGMLRRRADRRGLSSKTLGHDSSYFKLTHCNQCNGSRLNEKARSVFINKKSIVDLVNIELDDLYFFIKDIKHPLARPVVEKMTEMIAGLKEIGLGYLCLSRSVRTLSGGESQRVKMARQLGSDLVEMIYILDEPTIGLHPRDISQMIRILKTIRDKGNSVLVVEHDPQVIKSADYLVDIGPLSGTKGGKIIFSGRPAEIIKSSSLTGEYLRKRSSIKINNIKKPDNWLTIKNANINNLKNLTVDIPTNVLTCITGVAGSGKSSLILDCFISQHPNAVVIDQSPVGVMSRGNPATYTQVFDLIRKLFAKTTSQNIGLFSFNSIGACNKCKGLGYLEIDMHFLSSVSLVCSECQGSRYRSSVLKYKYYGKSIAEVLQMTIFEALEFFNNDEIKKRLNILNEVGLDYLTLGQPLNSLSGGEVQRVKLASQLYKNSHVYILDEPTTGLHMADIKKLVLILKKIVNNGNTVIVIEHNLDVISQADWIIDLGPDGGKRGGEITVSGQPKEIMLCKKSYTGQYLKKYYENN